MKKQLSLIGITITFIVMGLKLIYLSIEAFKFNYFLFAVFLIINIFFIISVVFTYLQIMKMENENIKKADFLFDFISISFGGLTVYFFANYLSFNSIVVVGVLSLLGGVFLKRFAAEITLGAFIGTSVFLSSNYFGVLVASFIATSVYFLLKGAFNGFGGKLGTSAFVGGLITYLIFSEEFLKGVSYSGINVFFVIIIALAAGVLTYILNNDFKLGPVTSYGIVVLIGSIFLFFNYTKDFNFTGVVYGSALVGMTSKRFDKSYFIAAIASLLFGIFFVTGYSFITIGGRVGLLSLISVLTAKSIYFLGLKINNHFKKLKESNG